MSRSNTVKAYHQDENDEIWQPGAEPGIDAAKDDDDPRLANLREMCDIDIIDYSDSELRSFSADNFTLSAVLEETRPEDLPCRWITVNGLSGDVIKILANKYKLHRLAVEDLIHTRTRTKVDWYSDHMFAVLTLQKLVRIHSHDKHDDCDCGFEGGVTAYGESHRSRPLFGSRKAQRSDDVLPKYEERPSSAKIKAHSTTSVEAPVKHIRTLHRYEGAHNPEHTAFMEKHSALAEEDLVVSVEQVAIFLMSDNTVITFFEHSGQDIEGPILARLESESTMLRRSEDASLLLQAIIDTIVDLAMPVKDAYNKARKDMQIDVLTNPDIGTSKSLYIFSEEIDMLQNLFKPIVHLVNALRDHQADPLNPASIAQQQAIIRENNRIRPELKSMMSASGTNSGMQSRKPAPRPGAGVSMTSSAVVITPLAHTYLGDVLDHCITIIQALEQMDASANNLSQLIFNTVGANTNNFMMILALVTVFFSPLTFISGYFGMNFVRFDAINQHSDAFFWIVALPSVAVFMFVVSGNMMWTFFKNMFMKFRIQRIRDKRFKMRRAAMGTIGRKRTKRKSTWNRHELEEVRTANASVDDGLDLKQTGRSVTT